MAHAAAFEIAAHHDGEFGAQIVGVSHGTHDTKDFRLSARKTNGHKSHLPVVIDLCQTRQLRVRPALDHMKEAKVGVLRHKPAEKVPVCRLIFRPDRSEQQRLCIDLYVFLQMPWIRSDRKALFAGKCCGPDADPGIQCHDSAIAGKQGIDVQFFDFRMFANDLRNGHQRLHQGIFIHCRHVPVGRQEFCHPGSANQVAGDCGVHGGQGEGAIANHFDGDATVSEHDGRSEKEVHGATDDQFSRMGVIDHFLNRKAADDRRRGAGLDPFEHVAHCGPQLLFVVKMQCNPAHITLVGDVGGENFQRNRITDPLR